MMKSALLIVIVMSSLCLAQKCDTIQQQYSVFATVNETKEWDMRKYFFTGENLRFQIPNDCPYFETIDPMAEIDEPIGHGDDSIGRIRGLKAYRSFESGAWLNDFIFLEQNKTDVDVFYYLGDPQQMDVVPSFKSQINVRNETKGLVCFDLDFLTNYKVIVDCYQAKDDSADGYSNGFIIVDFADPSKYDLQPNVHPDGYKYNYTEFRKILFHNYTFANVGDEQDEGGFQGDTLQLLFRGEPAWATEHADLSQDKLDDDCELEVYKFVNNKLANEGKPVAVLTKTILADLLKQDPTKQKFYLMDFQVEPNGDIYILDAYQGVFVVYFSGQDLTWKYKERISPPYLTVCYGFDFNYLLNVDGSFTKHLVLVFKDSANFYENGLQKFNIKLPYKLQYGDKMQVQMSQYFLVLRVDAIMYLYHSNDGKKLFTYTKDIVEELIINPYEPDMVAVNEVSSHRFLLTNGLLRLKRQDSTNDGVKTYTVNAISLDDSSKCQISVNVRVLKKTDTTIYEQSTHPFPATLTVPAPPIGIDLIASGPNLQYTSVLNLENENLGASNILITIKSAWNLNLNGIKLPDAKDVIYSDILVTDNANQFYLLLQIPTKIIYVYKCEHKLTDYEKAECSDFDNFQINVQIDKKKHSFQWWLFVNQITYMYQDTDYSIQIYTSMGGKVNSVGKITVDSSDSDNKITSVTITYNGVYLVQEGKKVVSIYSPYTPFGFIYEINSKVLAAYNVKDYFIPKRVFGNKKVRSQLVFIQTLQHLYVGDFTNSKTVRSYVLFRQMPILAGADVEVAIGLDHFFVVQKLDDQDLIEEYNYMHLQRIYKTKDIPLFNYKLQKPLTIDSSSQTGWLFVRATDGTETVVLVYEPGVVSHICLHKVLETKAQQFDGKTFDMAIDGGNQMFSYFNNNTIHRVVSILADAELYLTPELEGQQYVNDVIASVQVSNFPSNKPITVSSKVTVLNTQSDAIIKQQLFDTKKKVFKFVKQAAEQTIEMGTDWYTGQILNFWVRCATCGADLKIQQMIVRINDGTDMKYDLSDGVQYGSNGQVYQARNAIIFQDAAGKFKQRTEIKTKTESCELVTVSQDLTFIISTWHNTKSEVGIYINSCPTAFSCTQFRQGFETIAGIQKIAKIQMIDKKNIIILSTDPENFGSQDNVILVTKFDYTETAFTISNIYTINDQYVGTKLLQIGDFDVVSYQVNGNTYNTIILTDLNNGLYFAHYTYDAQGALAKTTFEQFKITSFQSEQLYLHDDTKFYQVKVINQQISGTTLQLNVLITTSNAAHYVLAFDLDVSKPASGVPLVKASTTLQYVLTPYGTWNSVDKSSYVNGHIAIPYTNEFQVLVAVYDLPSERTTAVKTIPFGHALSADYHKVLPIDFAMLLTKDSGAKYPYLYVNINYDVQSDEYLVEKYELRAGPRLVLTNSTSYADDVPITLYISNNFIETQGKAILSINGSPVPPDDDDKKGGSKWWWITLIVIFGVAILGVGGWFAYQKFGRKGVDPLLG